MNEFAHKIKPGWSLPAPPDGFDIAVAFYYADGQVELDWTREPERDFSSENDDTHVIIEWPFIEGTDHITSDNKPNGGLWQAVGITPIW